MRDQWAVPDACSGMPRFHGITASLAIVFLIGACDSAKENAAPKADAAKKTEAAKEDEPAKAEPAKEAEPNEAEPAKEAEPDKAEAPAKPLTAFPAMPDDAVELKLETLGGQFKAPKGAKLGMNINGWQDVSSGDDFAMVIRESYDEIDAIKKDLGEVKYVVEEPGTLVYEKDGGFGFVAIVEAKGPEELEGEADRRVECRAGGAKDWVLSKKPKHYPRETVDLMVATCHSFGLAEI